MITEEIMKVLEEFHNLIDMSITGKTARHVWEEDWECPLGGSGHRGGGAMDNAGIGTEATGNHCEVHYVTNDLQFVYWDGADSGVQLEPELVGSGPHTGGGGEMSQLRGGG